MNRTTTAVLLACGVFAYSEGWGGSWIGSRSLEPQERKAVELQCGSMEPALRTVCESDTEDSLVAGEFDPEPVLRFHCTRFENLWAGDVEIPPDLCIQRYGGWLHG